MLQRLKPLPVNTLLLDRSNDSLHQPVLLRAMRRDEFLLQTVTLDQSGIAAACEHQSVVAPQQKRHCHPAKRRKLPQTVNKLKIETSISLEMRDEEVEIYGKPNCWHIG